jgi:RNA polymerase sigma factor (sigma-70 family)
VATTDPTPAHAGRLTSEAAGERLSVLFEEHGRMVYGLCRLLLRDADEAEDAAQQVFLSAHRSMLGGTEPREPAAWLGTIARNECHMRIRERMATPLALVVDDRDALAPGVEQVAGQRAEIQALCAALAELPQQQREAVVLREFYGLSYEEVRAALGLTDGAVESLLFRARKRLQAELRPARVASGALALPLALRDSIAAAVPGFGPGPSAGVLGKLASAPLIAKLVGAAATLTVAGGIGYVEVGARDHDVTARPAVTGVEQHSVRRSEKPVQLERVSLVTVEPARSVAVHETRVDAVDKDDEGSEDPQDEPESKERGEQGEVENESGAQDTSETESDGRGNAEDETGNGDSGASGSSSSDSSDSDG